MIDSVATNLVLPDGRLRHNMQPAGCQRSDEVAAVLITRYWVSDRSAMPPAEYWEHRADLFRTWCAPSVRAQTRKPDAWLILVSDWAVGLIGDKVHATIDELPYAHLVTVPDGRSHGAETKRWVTDLHPELQTGHAWTIACRFDNDDAIARDYLDVLTKWIPRAKPPTPCTLVLSHGLQHRLQTDTTMLDMNGTNHFTGILTRGRQFLGAFGPNHTEIYKERDPSLAGGVHQIQTRWPMWAEILHRANAANHPRPGPTVTFDSRFWADRFGVSYG